MNMILEFLWNLISRLFTSTFWICVFMMLAYWGNSIRMTTLDPATRAYYECGGSSPYSRMLNNQQSLYYVPPDEICYRTKLLRLKSER